MTLNNEHKTTAENKGIEEKAPNAEIEACYQALYIYFSFDSFCKALDSWSLKACQAHEVNDPMENKPKKPSKIHDEAPPFFCMSKVMSNDAMWGSYADRGRGLCLVFCFPEEYLNEHAADSNETDQAKKAIFKAIKYEVLRPDVKNSIDALSSKGKYWEYEKEIRCFTQYEASSHSTNNMLFFRWPMRYLAGAIIGPECDCTIQFIKQKLHLAYKNHYVNIASKLDLHDPQNGARCIFRHSTPESAGFYVEKASIHPSHYEIATEFWTNDKTLTRRKFFKKILKQQSSTS